ncbi:MAG: sigma-70 family RNA polymerase sigma factor [Deltaproteobacteria bacterium]|nr:sigma-70 family RNA polymerase sigma factor [Deltaproteobacteria bacterium]
MSAASSGVYDDVGAGVHGGLAPTSFAALYREHAAFTWAVLRRLGVQPAAIDDAMQELWVTAHRRLATLHGPTAARAWLYGIARRVVSHQRRTEQRHRRKIDALEHAVTPDPDRTDVAGSLVVESILAGLDDRVREAFVLSELEGWTAAEIAKATGANANTVSWRVRVAKQELRERFADDARAGAAVIDLRERTKASKRVTQHCWFVDRAGGGQGRCRRWHRRGDVVRRAQARGDRCDPHGRGRPRDRGCAASCARARHEFERRARGSRRRGGGRCRCRSGPGDHPGGRRFARRPLAAAGW